MGMELKNYAKDRAWALLAFIGDLCAGAFFFAFLLGRSFQFFNEILSLLEIIGRQIGISALFPHLYGMWAVTLMIRGIFILIIGRSLGDMALGRNPYGEMKIRVRRTLLNFLTIFIPPLALNTSHRRRSKTSWGLVAVLTILGLLWPGPMLWRLSQGQKVGSISQLTEVKLNVENGDFGQSVVFESNLFGLEALAEGPETMAIFPCPQFLNGRIGHGIPHMCFFELSTGQWLILSRPDFFSLQDPVKRYSEFSGIFQKITVANLAELVSDALELGPYDGIVSVIKHGPFLQGLMHIKLYLEQLMDTRNMLGENGEASDHSKLEQRISLVRIGERNFFQILSENAHEWVLVLYPLELQPSPILKMSGPKKGQELRAKFEKTFLPSIKWAEEKNVDGLGQLCDYIFSGNIPQKGEQSSSKEDLELESKIQKLYTALAERAVKEKRSALKYLLKRSLLQFKHTKYDKISLQMEKKMAQLYQGLSNENIVKDREEWK